MDKLQEFLILMNTLTSKTIIFTNQGTVLPPYPFITFQSIDRDRENFNILKRELLNLDLDVKEIANKKVTEIIQVDFYSDTFLGVRDLSKDFIDGIDFKYRREINENEFGIIDIGGIIDNTSLEQVQPLFRYTCDITIDYTEEIERIVENLQSVTFKEITDNKDETVTR
jgi:hypothetical protein